MGAYWIPARRRRDTWHAERQHSRVVFETGAKPVKHATNCIDDVQGSGRRVRLREAQQRTLIVVARKADSGACFGQSIRVQHQRVAGIKTEPIGHEVWLCRYACGLAAGGVDIVDAAVGT